jgi:hypothetical protein
LPCSDTHEAAAKKTETPKLWLRLAEEWGVSCVFGEVRMAEQALMKRHGMQEDNLPRVVAFVAADGEPHQHRAINYDGPTDFDRISDFLGDLSKGGMHVSAMPCLLKRLCIMCPDTGTCVCVRVIYFLDQKNASQAKFCLFKSLHFVCP